jgi:hypothetical protein
MSKFKKTIILLGSSGLSIVIAYSALCIFIGYKKGYTYKTMDWNQDGYTSLMELISSSDIGSRNISVNGEHCIEYYAYKDGLPVKVICPNGNK